MNWKYIEANAVVARVLELFPDGMTNELKLYKWLSDGIKMVYTNEALQDAICFSEVKDYNAYMPNEFFRIDQMMYTQDVSMVEGTVIKMVGHNYTNKNITMSTNNGQFVDLQDSVDADELRSLEDRTITGREVPFTHMTFQQDWSESLSDWKPFIKSTSKFHKTRVTNHDVSGECGKETYSYNISCNSITTSFQEGWVCVSYKEYPKCGSHTLIPGMESGVPQALEAYLMYKVFEVQTIKSVRGSIGLADRYIRKWEVLAAKAKGNLKKLSLEDMENMKAAMVRLTPHNNSFQTGFGNLNDRENFNFR